MTVVKNYILDAAVADKKLRRIALEIIENNAGTEELVLAGIRDNGSAIARVLQAIIAEYSSVKTVLIELSLDKRTPRAIELSQPLNFDNKTIIVVDDVANSGKTLLYAMKPFLEYQPARIQTAVLVGRSHNSFPVYPDYVGLSIATTLQEHIFVEVEEGKVRGAYLA